MRYPVMTLCPTCGCAEVQSSGWVETNKRMIVSDEGPVSYYYCPLCAAQGGDGIISRARRVSLPEAPGGKIEEDAMGPFLQLVRYMIRHFAESLREEDDEW